MSEHEENDENQPEPAARRVDNHAMSKWKSNFLKLGIAATTLGPMVSTTSCHKPATPAPSGNTTGTTDTTKINEGYYCQIYGTNNVDLSGFTYPVIKLGDYWNYNSDTVNNVPENAIACIDYTGVDASDIYEQKYLIPYLTESSYLGETRNGRKVLNEKDPNTIKGLKNITAQAIKDSHGRVCLTGADDLTIIGADGAATAATFDTLADMVNNAPGNPLLVSGSAVVVGGSVDQLVAAAKKTPNLMVQLDHPVDTSFVAGRIAQAADSSNRDLNILFAIVHPGQTITAETIDTDNKLLKRLHAQIKLQTTHNVGIYQFSVSGDGFTNVADVTIAAGNRGAQRTTAPNTTVSGGGTVQYIYTGQPASEATTTR